MVPPFLMYRLIKGALFIAFKSLSTHDAVVASVARSNLIGVDPTAIVTMFLPLQVFLDKSGGM